MSLSEKLERLTRNNEIIRKRELRCIPGRWDEQDDPDYWNEPERVENDTGNLPSGFPAGDKLLGWITENLSRLDLSDDARILEFGCGGGRALLIWSIIRERLDAKWQLEGLDHAEVAIKLAESRLPDFTFHVGEIYSLEMHNWYDLIITNWALQHNSGWKQKDIYPEFHRLLKPNRMLWLMDEKTFLQEEVLEISEKVNMKFRDDRCSAGTPLHWIEFITGHKFELMFYAESSYLFRAIKEE